MGPVGVRGLAELQRDLKKMSKTLSRELQAELVKVGEPVRREAERLAGGEIRNVLSPTAEVDWWQMRLGVTSKVVYVAPKQRGTRNSQLRRPNMGTLLMEKALLPALASKEPEVVAGLDSMLGRFTALNGF